MSIYGSSLLSIPSWVAFFSQPIVLTTLGHEEHEENQKMRKRTLLGSFRPVRDFKKILSFVSFVLFVVKYPLSSFQGMEDKARRGFRIKVGGVMGHP
jgi:hypothetical protein